MIIITDPKERTRFLKFAVVGTIGFGVDFLTFNLFRSGAGLSAELSSVLSFILAVISNFTLNRYWTYPDSRSKPVFSQLGQFGIVNIVGLLIRYSVFVVILAPIVQLFETANLNLPIPANIIGENVSLAIVVIIVMFWNFFANRFWTYNDVD